MLKLAAGLLLISFALCDEFHPDLESPRSRRLSKSNPEELDSLFWTAKSVKILLDKLPLKLNTNPAKNVILFLGDGMSVPTLTATRAYQGELNGKYRSGEGNSLSFENFPFTGLSHTYAVNYKVPDSACTATAYLGGVKGNVGTIGVNGNVARFDCEAMQNTSYHVDSIAQWFQNKGLATGLVTTARVTHASPAGVYAHTANRDWENDGNVADMNVDPNKCHDIAYQMVMNSPGAGLNVAMGGGRKGFLPTSQGGSRRDNRNLIDAWKNNKTGKASYITSRQELQALGEGETPDYVLGLFADEHMDDHLRNNTAQPTLAEMTEMAIRVLDKKGAGYFLFVEGAKIDLAHHGNQAHISLDETVEFAKAVDVAKRLTNSSETLIVVTADHSHTFSYSGYALREDPIFGFAGKGDDGKVYTSLSYANGPGFKLQNGGRADLSKDDTEGFSYTFPSAVPLGSETHGGDDVAVFADGPWAHLFTGSYEQNFIAHAMGFAACVTEGYTPCTSHN